jgi:hypothetical protein
MLFLLQVKVHARSFPMKEWTRLDWGVALVSLALHSWLLFALRSPSRNSASQAHETVVFVHPEALAPHKGAVSTGGKNLSASMGDIKKLFELPFSPAEVGRTVAPDQEGETTTASAAEQIHGYGVATVDIIEGLQNPWSLRIAQKLKDTLNFSYDLYRLAPEGNCNISLGFTKSGKMDTHRLKGQSPNVFLLTYSLRTILTTFDEISNNEESSVLRFQIHYKTVQRSLELNKPLSWIKDRFFIEKSRINKDLKIGSAKFTLNPWKRDTDGAAEQGSLGLGLSWNFNPDRFFDRDIQKALDAPDPIILLRKTLLGLYEVYSQRGYIN